MLQSQYLGLAGMHFIAVEQLKIAIMLNSLLHSTENSPLVTSIKKALIVQLYLQLYQNGIHQRTKTVIWENFCSFSWSTTLQNKYIRVSLSSRQQRLIHRPPNKVKASKMRRFHCGKTSHIAKDCQVQRIELSIKRIIM